MMEGNDVPSMESLVQELASSRLDASSPSKRNEAIQKAAKRVTENADDRAVLASLKGVYPSVFLREARTALYVENSCSQFHKICRHDIVRFRSWRSSHDGRVLSCPCERRKG
jgi:hypothetical protein